MSKDLTTTEKARMLMPESIGEVFKLAERAANTKLIPQQFQGKPDDTAIAMLMLHESGMPLLTGLRFVAVVNGRPAFYSEAVPALAESRGHIKHRKEWIEGEGDAMTAHCEVTNARGDVYTQSFSMADAKRAGLAGKDTYKAYPQRMLMWRARSWAIRDAAPAAFIGPTAEELQDADDYHGPEYAKDVTPQIAPKAKKATTKEQVMDQLRSVAEDGQDEQVDAETGEIADTLSSSERTEQIVAAMRDAPTKEALAVLGKLKKAEIDELPQDHRGEVRAAYREAQAKFADQLEFGGN